MDNLNFAFKEGSSDEFELDLEGKYKAFISNVGEEKVINIYDGSAVVLTLTAPKITVWDYWGWGD